MDYEGRMRYIRFVSYSQSLLLFSKLTFYKLKDVPQPQLDFACGFLNTKADSKSS